MPKEYSAIIADPPWQYDGDGPIDDKKRYKHPLDSKVLTVSANQHYRTTSLEDLKKLRIPAAKNCIMFMWVTNPFLCDGSGPELMRAWGFQPKSVITWGKVQKNGEPSRKVGHWFRSATEHVIFGIRGSPRRPENFPALPTWFAAPRLAHSVKPTIIHQWAQICAPQGPWLEMFARRAHPGWDLMGDQAPVGRRIELL